MPRASTPMKPAPKPKRGKPPKKAAAKSGRRRGAEKAKAKSLGALAIKPSNARPPQELPPREAQLDTTYLNEQRLLIGREEECKTILDFISNVIRRNSAARQVMLITGVVGNGKTFSVDISRRKAQENIDPDQYIYLYVNAASSVCKKPEVIYVQLWRKIVLHNNRTKGKDSLPNQSHKTCQDNLAQFFGLLEKPKGGKPTRIQAMGIEPTTPIVMVADEMDFLLNGNGVVMHNLLEWANREGSPLHIIGIANTLNLMEKTHQRLKSRGGHGSLQFEPYNVEQLKVICQSYADKNGWKIDREGLSRVSSKVALGSNGDVRVAFSLLKQAHNCAAAAGNGKEGEVVIRIPHVAAALEMCQGDSHHSALRHLPFCSKVMVLAAGAEGFEIFERRELEEAQREVGGLMVEDEDGVEKLAGSGFDRNKLAYSSADMKAYDISVESVIQRYRRYCIALFPEVYGLQSSCEYRWDASLAPNVEESLTVLTRLSDLGVIQPGVCNDGGRFRPFPVKEGRPGLPCLGMHSSFHFRLTMGTSFITTLLTDFLVVCNRMIAQRPNGPSVPELREMTRDMLLLDLRQKFMRPELQAPSENPLRIAAPHPGSAAPLAIM